VAEVVGGVIAPTVAGMLGDALSPAAPFFLCAGGALLAGMACFGLIETAPAVLKRLGPVHTTDARCVATRKPAS